MKRKKRNSFYVIILLILFMSIGLGYSYLASSLGVNIGVKISKRRDMYFDNVSVIENSVVPNVAAVADKMTTKLNFNVTFSSTDDSYSFYVDVKNDTKKEYMLSEIITLGLTDEQSSIIDYVVTYADNSIPEEKDLFFDYTSRFKVSISVKEGISLIDEQILDLSLELKYILSGNSGLFSPYYYLASNAEDDSSINFSDESSSSSELGIYTLSSTKNNEYPVYYYRGNVSNNNVLFADMCWKIVRTTDTRGIKLLYNGSSTTSGKCNDSSSKVISTSSFSNNANYISNVGYMQGDKKSLALYENNSDDIKRYLVSSYSVSNTISIFYGTSYQRRVGSVNTSDYGYTIFYFPSSSTGLFSNAYTLFKSTSDIERMRTDSVSSFTLSDYAKYVVSSTKSSSSTRTFYFIPEGTYSSYIDFGKNFTINDDGTYSLNNINSVLRRNWYGLSSSNREKYIGYYVCRDVSENYTCSSLLRITDVFDRGVTGSLVDKIKFGSSVSYSDGQYVLNDVTTSSNMVPIQYNYTCLDDTSSCETVYYVMGHSPSTFYYVSLTGGDVISTDELYKNSEDSKIKNIIDEWYNDKLLSYENVIEDTVWCNDRSFLEDSSSVGDSLILYSGYNRKHVLYKPSVECSSVRDRFTKSSEIGNGKLTYPVGLLTYDEVVLGGVTDSYLSGNKFWTMTPSKLSVGSSNNLVSYMSMGGSSGDVAVNSIAGIRPSISLKYGIKFYNGDGSSSNPFKIYDES